MCPKASGATLAPTEVPTETSKVVTKSQSMDDSQLSALTDAGNIDQCPPEGEETPAVAGTALAANAGDGCTYTL